MAGQVSPYTLWITTIILIMADAVALCDEIWFRSLSAFVTIQEALTASPRETPQSSQFYW